MYKLIIVDDEQGVREGLKTSVEWNKYDIEVVGIASNGKKALALIKEQKPELIITDIYMPEMDGLELIAKVNEILPYTKVIIMSGYKDFEYAQTAIRNKAFDYILKPIDLEKMISTLNKAKIQVEQELMEVKDKQLLEKQLQESIPVLRDRYMDYLLTDRLSLEELKKHYTFIDWHLNDHDFIVMAMSLNPLEENCTEGGNKHLPVTDIIGIKKVITYIINNDIGGEVVKGDRSKFIAILNFAGNEKKDFLERLLFTAKRIQNQINNLYQVTLTIGIGRLYHDASLISKSYQEALEAIEYQIFLGKGEIIYIDDVSVDTGGAFISYPVIKENELITSLKIGDEVRVKELTRDFISPFQQQGQITPEVIKSYSLQLLYTVLKKLVEWNLKIDLRRKMIEENIYNVVTLEELEDYLLSFMEEILVKIKERQENHNCCYIQKACKYIRENYSKDISLLNIANNVRITPQYLANIFKEEMGKTVICYLTALRIEKAKDLLTNTDLKVYQVAEKVGYQDSRYFSKVFKKQVNCTPNEYK